MTIYPYFIVKTVVMSGKAPVDADCPLVGKAHVYYEGSDIYDCMLNQVCYLFSITYILIYSVMTCCFPSKQAPTNLDLSIYLDLDFYIVFEGKKHLYRKIIQEWFRYFRSFKRNG